MPIKKILIVIPARGGSKGIKRKNMRLLGNKNHFVKEILRLIEVAVALGDEKASKEIKKKALAVIDDKRIRDAVTSKK